MGIVGSVLGLVLTLAGIGADIWASKTIEDYTSQVEAFVEMFETGATLDDFISQCWLILLFLFCVMWFGLSIAFPKRRRGSRA